MSLAPHRLPCMLFASRLHFRVAIKAVGAPGTSIAAGKDATKLLAFGGRRTLRIDTVRRTSRTTPAAGMATGGGKDSDIVSRIGKNVVQNVKTKEVTYGLPFSQCQLKHASQNVLRYVELTYLSLRRPSYPPHRTWRWTPYGQTAQQSSCFCGDSDDSCVGWEPCVSARSGRRWTPTASNWWLWDWSNLGLRNLWNNVSLTGVSKRTHVNTAAILFKSVVPQIVCLALTLLFMPCL